MPYSIRFHNLDDNSLNFTVSFAKTAKAAILETVDLLIPNEAFNTIQISASIISDDLDLYPTNDPEFREPPGYA